MKIFQKFFINDGKRIISLTGILFNIGMGGLMMVFSGWNTLSHAEGSTELYSCSAYPCSETFITTAYYSPLPGQEKYTTGSYESEIRLEGNGTNGASGKEVYPGMIAAPKIFPFGMKIELPMGIGTVYDRGGAIVAKGERGFQYHRLDIWMGKGDKGRRRALAWGRRTVEARVLGIDANIKDTINLEGFTELEDALRKNIPLFQAKIFKSDFGPGDTDPDIAKLQQYLFAMNYYNGVITGQYDEATRQGVESFQLAYKVIDDAQELGAGYLGPMTRKTFDQAISDLEVGKFFTADLGKDKEGEIVTQLQKSLKRLGYFHKEASGKYDPETIEAVYQFQKSQSLIPNEADPGAGYFGPKTREVLQKALLNLAREEDIKKKEFDDLFASNHILDSHPDLQEKIPVIKKTLEIKDSNDDVKILQEELRQLGYFRGPVSGNFGPVTAHAVLKLQQAVGIIEDENMKGAGVVGSKTKAYINDLREKRLGVKKMIAYHREETKKNQTELAQTKTNNVAKMAFLNTDLGLGDRGQAVQTLQQFLIVQGFLDSKLPSDYFGEKTKQAVMAFQLKNGIVTSKEDTGAGRVGPKTREMMQKLGQTV